MSIVNKETETTNQKHQPDFKRNYTVRHKNTPKFFHHNFYNTWPILIESDVQCRG